VLQLSFSLSLMSLIISSFLRSTAHDIAAAAAAAATAEFDHT
jgi:hypothetical protein